MEKLEIEVRKFELNEADLNTQTVGNPENILLNEKIQSLLRNYQFSPFNFNDYHISDSQEYSLENFNGIIHYYYLIHLSNKRIILNYHSSAL